MLTEVCVPLPLALSLARTPDRFLLVAAQLWAGPCWLPWSLDCSQRAAVSLQVTAPGFGALAQFVSNGCMHTSGRTVEKGLGAVQPTSTDLEFLPNPTLPPSV